MPPKNMSAKAIAAEIKKKTDSQANEIVSQLLLEMGQTVGDSVVKKPTVMKPENAVASDSGIKGKAQTDPVVPMSKRSKRSAQGKISTASAEVEAKIKATSSRAVSAGVEQPTKAMQLSKTVKNSAKAIAAEMKKKADSQANEIVSQLQLEIGQTVGDSVVKKPTVKKPESAVASDTGKKRKTGDKADVPMSKRYKRSPQGKVSTANGEVEAKIKATSSRAVSASVEQPTKSMQLSETVKNSAEMPSMSFRGTTSSSKDSTSKFKGNPVNRKYVGPRSHTPHGSGYQYEIDCEKVADSIEVQDLKIFLETQLKVDGKKNNLGSTVSIICQGNKVILRSKTFVPKKSLRFLSRKFLKRNWNIRVLTKNVHAYQYVYVGTA